MRRPFSGAGRIRCADAVVGVGLVVLAIGTFLPWLRSGSSERMSYAAAGILRSIVTLDAVTRAVLVAWPLLPLLCALALGLVIARYRRSGSLVALVTALVATFAAIRVLLLHSTSFAGASLVGPAVTLGGCAAVVAGAFAVILSSRRSRRPS